MPSASLNVSDTLPFQQNTLTVSQPCTVWLPVPSRTAWGDDLCSFNQRHGDLRPPDDVFYYPPNCLLHRLDLRRRHHAHAVLHEHTVRLRI